MPALDHNGPHCERWFSDKSAALHVMRRNVRTEYPHNAADRVKCDSRRRGLAGERFFREYHAELVSLGSASTVCRCRPGVSQRRKPLSLLFAILRAARQVRLDAVLDRLRIGDRHEAHADRRVSSVPMTISPSSRVHASRTGAARAVVSVNGEVMEPDRRGISMCGAPDCIPRTGLLLSRSAQVTAGAASSDIADQRAQRPNGRNQVLEPAWRRTASAARGHHHRSPPVST